MKETDDDPLVLSCVSDDKNYLADFKVNVVFDARDESQDPDQHRGYIDSSRKLALRLLFPPLPAASRKAAFARTVVQKFFDDHQTKDVQC